MRWPKSFGGRSQHRCNYRDLGPVKNVSRLTLGGGGLGQLWGETDRDEAIATVRAALDGGINLIDTAPLCIRTARR